MVSQRRRKKVAARAGMTEPELGMLEILEEVLERFRWLQVLAHTQSFLLREKLKISDEELDRVLEAASRSIEKDGTWKRWQEGLGKLRGEILKGRRDIRRERKLMKRARDGQAEGSEQGGAG
ncbi:MAG: hypothetical protein ACE5F1_08510 [Planctomycetota bacterium]